MSKAETSRCGYIAIVGRPNVGKSTLLNHLVGTKVAITSRKPQTTRHAIQAIKTKGKNQFIFVDTPGFELSHNRQINRVLNKSVTSAIHDVDALVFVVEGLQWTEEDQVVLESIAEVKAPAVLIINKIDKIADKKELLPCMSKLSSLRNWHAIIPVSALKGLELDALEEELGRLLPEQAHFYDEDELTDRPVRFFVGEIVREKITRLMGDEIPYDVAVQVVRFEDQPQIANIDVEIYVERESQKKMIVGRGGEKIKLIGTDARQDIEQVIDKKVMLNLWVKTRTGWADDINILRSLGIETD
jgi:GTP-binding protein Era